MKGMDERKERLVELRKLTSQELAWLAVGDKVWVRYFDPNGPNPDPITHMTTEEGVVAEFQGDPLDQTVRTVIVRFPNRWLDYFGSSLLKERNEDDR